MRETSRAWTEPFSHHSHDRRQQLIIFMPDTLEYLIAGPADDEDYAQAEYLAEMLMVSLPSIKCTLMPIMPDEWQAFAVKQCGFLGCKQRAPLVWMASGAVVGGFPEWAGECEKKYGVRITGIDVSATPAKNKTAEEKKRPVTRTRTHC